jgi:hypothetical protein
VHANPFWLAWLMSLVRQHCHFKKKLNMLHCFFKGSITIWTSTYEEFILGFLIIALASVSLDAYIHFIIV